MKREYINTAQKVVELQAALATCEAKLAEARAEVSEWKDTAATILRAGNEARADAERLAADLRAIYAYARGLDQGAVTLEYPASLAAHERGRNDAP